MPHIDTGWRSNRNIMKLPGHMRLNPRHRRRSLLWDGHVRCDTVVLGIVACCLVTSLVEGYDLFSATDTLEELVTTERNLVGLLENYLHQEEDRIRRLRSYVNYYYTSTPEVGVNIAENPLHAYLMLKRMTAEWRQVETILAETNECGTYRATRQLISTSTSRASTSDVRGAALAVVRLQDVYNLSVSDLMEGRFAGFNTGTSLTANDCMLFANEAVMSANLESAENWLHHCQRLGSSTDDGLMISRRVAPGHPSNHSFNGDDLMTSSLQRDVIGSPTNYDINIDVEKRLQQVETLRHMFDAPLNTSGSLRQTLIPYITADRFSAMREDYKDTESKKKLIGVYKKLCQGEDLRPKWLDANMQCFLHPGYNAWYWLQPFRLEYLSYQPVVTIFHDVLSDRDTQHLKTMAKPHLRVSLVHKGGELNGTVSSVRVGKMAWLQEHNDPLVGQIYQVVNSMTGLSTRSAEDLQVLNYGVGGHYETHTDFFDFHSKNIVGPAGDRIATILFYLSDVQAGGATVFPSLALSVFPKKGSVLFWYNLHKNGKGDYRTVHAACPVLTGSKWVANLWLHDLGQERVRPCSRNEDE